jgi:tetratricopeptide (TPR) repeat protein
MKIAALLIALAISAEDVEAAKQYFEAGRSAYEAGHYSIAAAAFEEAYKLSPRPPVIFSLAQAHRQQYLADRSPARLERALALFREYVKMVPAGGRHDHARQHIVDLEDTLARLPQTGRIERPAGLAEAKTQLMITSRTSNALAAIGGEEASELPQIRDVQAGKHKVRVEAEGFISEELEAVAVEGRLVVVDVSLKEKPGVIRVAAPDGSDVSLDGRLIGEAPLTAPVEVPPGRHFLAVTQRGSYGFARDLTLGRGEQLAIEAELESTTQRTVSYVFLGTAGALLVSGAITGGIALGAQHRAQEIDAKRTARFGLMLQDLEDYRKSVETRDTFAPASFTLLGVGVSAAITGALLYFIDSPRIDAR